MLEQTAQTLRHEFPKALLMTTSYDHSYGLDTVVKTMDAWCPLTPSFKPDQAARAREAGRQVWWYICCGPHHPHANMFIEYPAIEGRLLMGAMTAKQRPDGFLYYQISIWNSRKPITSGPFTDWDPRSWTTYHGDGSWTCVGPDGTPLPTIRLENFRDGLEDYAYAIILEEIIRQREASAKALTPADKEWLTNAKAALPVPGTLVKSMTEYSTEPAQLYAWRNRIGDLIDSSGAADVNPWGPNFGVRGLAAVRATTRSIPLLTEQGPDGEFPGWKSFHETPGTRTAEVWQLQPDGVLICKGRPRGYLYTEQDYQDFTLQFEWRYPPGATNSNGGALVRMTGEHGIWPRCLEFQLNQNQAGDFWAIRGYEFTGPSEQLRVMTNASFGILRHLKRQADREKPVGRMEPVRGHCGRRDGHPESQWRGGEPSHRLRRSARQDPYHLGGTRDSLPQRAAGAPAVTLRTSLPPDQYNFLSEDDPEMNSSHAKPRAFCAVEVRPGSPGCQFGGYSWSLGLQFCGRGTRTPPKGRSMSSPDLAGISAVYKFAQTRETDTPWARQARVFRQGCVGLDLPADLHPANLRQHDIQEHQIRAPFARCLEALLAG